MSNKSLGCVGKAAYVTSAKAIKRKRLNGKITLATYACMCLIIQVTY